MVDVVHSFTSAAAVTPRRFDMCLADLEGTNTQKASQNILQASGCAPILRVRVEEESTHVDVICVNVVICAFQDDPRGIVCRGRREETTDRRVRVQHGTEYRCNKDETEKKFCACVAPKDTRRRRTRRDVSVAVFGNVLR